MQKNKIKNVIIVNDFDYIQGGASKVAIDTANILVSHGINVYFFSGDSSTSSTLDKKVIRITTNQKESLKDSNKIRGAFNGIYNFKAKKELKKLLLKLDNKNTIVHVHGWTKCLSSSIFSITKKLKYKTIITIHDYFSACPNGGFYNYKSGEICNLKGNSLRCILCNCDSRNYMFKIYRVIRQTIQNSILNKMKNISIISISDFSIDKLKKYYTSDVLIKKIYNPINVIKDKNINIEKNKYYVFVGRVTKEKGVSIFCKALDKLRLNGIVVGDGELKEELEKKFPRINFVGWKNSDEVNSYIRNSKCLIFPSQWYEGAPLTILESLSQGVPCIVSNKCAGIEFIDDKKNGLIFDGTTKDLINKIKEYEKSNIKDFNKYAYDNYWKKPYDFERNYLGIYEYYNEILSGGNNEK